MFYLYHIKGIKWGCTKNLEQRLKRQGYSISDCANVITVGNIDKASKMEKELNLQYGYAWQDTQNYKYVTKKWCTKEASTKGAKNSGIANRIPILCYEYNTSKFVSEFESIRKASIVLNIPHPNIIRHLSGVTKQVKGYTFEYKIVK